MRQQFHSTVNDVKKYAAITLLAATLVGCDNSSAPLSFTPEMASFSNEFDFDAARPGERLTQTLFNEKGEVSKRVTGTVSTEGCFDTWSCTTWRPIPAWRWCWMPITTLMRNPAAKVKLQGKCQLAELPSAGITWDTDDNGFVVAAHGKEMEVKYRYDADGYPLGKTTVSGDQHLSVQSTPSKDVRKRMDYSAVSMLNDKPLGNVKQSCDYDRHNNPVSCDLTITDDSVKPAVEHKYTIKNTIEYY
jgi:hypothetical protein